MCNHGDKKSHPLLCGQLEGTFALADVRPSERCARCVQGLAQAGEESRGRDSIAFSVVYRLVAVYFIGDRYSVVDVAAPSVALAGLGRIGAEVPPVCGLFRCCTLSILLGSVPCGSSAQRDNCSRSFFLEC